MTRQSRFVLLLVAAAVVFIVFAKSNTRKAAPPAGDAAALLADAAKEGRPAWLLVHSNMCAACKEMSRVFAGLKTQYGERIAFVEVQFDDQAQQATLAKYGVKMIPTTVLLDRRGKVDFNQVGPLTREEMDARLSGLLEDAK